MTIEAKIIKSSLILFIIQLVDFYNVTVCSAQN